MQTLKFYENETSMCEIELQSINDEMARLTREAAELLDRECALSSDDLRNGKKHEIREARTKLANRLSDLEEAKAKVEREMSKLESCMELAALQPMVDEYQAASETFLKSLEEISDKIEELTKLTGKLLTLAEAFLQMQNPLSILVGLHRKVEDLGFSLPDFLQGKVVESGKSDTNIGQELVKFEIPLITAPDLQKVVRAISDVQDRLKFNSRAYAGQFSSKGKNAPVLKSGRMPGEKITRVIGKDAVPDIQRRPQNYFKEDLKAAGVTL